MIYSLYTVSLKVENACVRACVHVGGRIHTKYTKSTLINFSTSVFVYSVSKGRKCVRVCVCACVQVYEYTHSIHSQKLEKIIKVEKTIKVER